MSNNLQHIIELTKDILKKDGFKNYLPTLILIDKKEVRVLENIPENTPQENAAKEWMEGISITRENYFLVFKTSDAQVKIEYYSGNELSESVVINELDC